MKKILLLILLTLVILCSCSSLVENPEYGQAPQSISGSGINYYYDSEHEVCIWTIRELDRCAMFVIPSKIVENPQLPMRLD